MTTDREQQEAKSNLVHSVSSEVQGPKSETLIPYAHGPAVCDDCGYRWVAVWPLGADALECPKCHSTNTDRTQETIVDRGLNRQARNPAAPASNGPKVENPQGFQEGAPRSRGAHRKVGMPGQHHAGCTRSHPHENMNGECERLTLVAREQNAARRAALSRALGEQQ